MADRIRATGVHYPPDQDALTERYDERPLAVEYDGDVVRIETGSGPDDNPDEQPFGAPGVSIEVTKEQAVRLAFAILQQADPQLLTELGHGLDRATDDLDYASKQEGNYEPGDMPGIQRSLKLWAFINERIVEAQQPAAPSLRVVRS